MGTPAVTATSLFAAPDLFSTPITVRMLTDETVAQETLRRCKDVIADPQLPTLPDGSPAIDFIVEFQIHPIAALPARAASPLQATRGEQGRAPSHLPDAKPDCTRNRLNARLWED